MTNRNLKKKIRQAFEHATPDHAESISLDSLLSDIPLKKGEGKSIQFSAPSKTTIQFRVIATLAASIAVVALLAGLIPNTNPFLPPSNHEDVYGEGPSDTTPPAVSDFDPEDLVLLDWDELYLRYFDQYFDIDYVYHHEVTTIGGKTCLVMAADYGHIGKYVLVDAATGQVRVEKDILGSNNAINLYQVKAGSEIDPNTVVWNLEYYKDTICYRLTNSGIPIKGFVMDAQNGQVIDSYILGGVIPETDSSGNLSNSESNALYITQTYAADLALEHAGLVRDELSYGVVIHDPMFTENPHYEISFSSSGYYYKYEISKTDGSILSASKKYHNATPIEPSTPIIDKNEAIRVAFTDPMIGDDATVLRVTKTSNDGIVYYNIYLNELNIQYEVEVLCAEGIILSIEMQRQEILYGNESNNDDTTPPDGKIGDDLAITKALAHAGLTIQEVGTAHCEEDADAEMPHYNVIFTHKGYDYKYEIGMYNAQLLSIEKEKHQ